jgi:hypothetical protein
LRVNYNSCTGRSNAQGLRVIIIVVQVEASENRNICNRKEALRKKERRDETQFTTKIGGKN